MALNNFDPSAYGMLGVNGTTSQRKAVPGGGGSTLLVTNLGPATVFVLLGGSTVSVTPSTGIAVLVGQALALAVGSNTYIAAIGDEENAIINLAQGDVPVS